MSLPDLRGSLFQRRPEFPGLRTIGTLLELVLDAPAFFSSRRVSPGVRGPRAPSPPRPARARKVFLEISSISRRVASIFSLTCWASRLPDRASALQLASRLRISSSTACVLQLTGFEGVDPSFACRHLGRLPAGCRLQPLEFEPHVLALLVDDHRLGAPGASGLGRGPRKPTPNRPPPPSRPTSAAMNFATHSSAFLLLQRKPEYVPRPWTESTRLPTTTGTTKRADFKPGAGEVGRI